MKLIDEECCEGDCVYL